MDVLMPQLGETVSGGKILRWFKSVGEAVASGENLCEVETDKVTIEVPVLESGFISAIKADRFSDRAGLTRAVQLGELARAAVAILEDVPLPGAIAHEPRCFRVFAAR